GHKQGNFFDREGIKDFSGILYLDQTELTGLDDLHHAESVIKEAEELARDAFGAEGTKFLVGGTTAGILALLLGVKAETIGVQRDSHKSVFNGLKLARKKGLLLPPVIDDSSLLPKGVNIKLLLSRLADHKMNALLLTSPNYFGYAIPLREIVCASHKEGIPLMVDEAHGAHFKFHSSFPPTALQQGADAVVQSIHKTLPAMTMASMIHWQGKRIDWKGVKEWLSAIQSSSPSYPLLASLDLARRHLALYGEEEFERAMKEMRSFRERLKGLPWLQAVENDDPLRLVLLLPEGWGQRLKEHLESLRIFLEMVTPYHLVFVFTPGNTAEDYEKLWSALTSFSLPSLKARFPTQIPYPMEIWGKEKVIAFDSLPMEKRKISLEEAAGKRAGEMIIPYPPGIPLLLEGETVEKEAIEWLFAWRREGNSVYGVYDDQIYIYDE
ncbi:MAG: ornithine decarboxylase, partial [Thermicanus sp.]|nr:ornithine decarboxylase [Thermicanus sp.]